MRFAQKLKAWVLLSRLPFHLVGLLPFTLGSVLCFYLNRTLNVSVFIWGLAGVFLIMLATYYNGELHDTKEDELSAKLGKSFFSGGSQVLAKGLISYAQVRIASYSAIIGAFLIGFLLQFHYKTGFWTLALGLSGAVSGFYYSKPPLRWVKTGFGELLIAYSYGWLPVAAGFYLQTGSLSPLVYWIALPVACSIFNVILINEFPDYPADTQAMKRNFLVRFGTIRAMVTYTLAAILGTAAFFVSLTKGLPLITGWFYAPVAIVSLAAVFMVLSGKFNDRALLEKICLLTLLTNLGTCLAYIIGLVYG